MMAENFNQDKFNQPGSGIMDPVEHSIVEEGWGAGLNRPDGPQLLEQWDGIRSIPELIQDGPK
jgi:hypothetical protein